MGAPSHLFGEIRIRLLAGKVERAAVYPAAMTAAIMKQALHGKAPWE
jgi:hypothetical protein